MKMTRFNEPQILAILHQAEGAVPVAELCCEHGMSIASFYKWRSKYGGMDAFVISQMKSLEDAVAEAHICGSQHAGQFAEGSPWEKVTRLCATPEPQLLLVSW
jgi:putative transposase